MRFAHVACVLLAAFLAILVVSCSPSGPEDSAADPMGFLPQPTPQPILDADRVLAKAGNGVVTTGDLIRFQMAEPNLIQVIHQAEPSLRDERIRHMTRQLVLQRELAERARQAGLDQDEDIQSRIRQIELDLAREAWNRLINQRMDPVTAAEIRAEYERNIDRYKLVGSVQFQFIFIRSDKSADSPSSRRLARERAQAARALIESGSEFAAVARRYSESSSEPGEIITEKLGKLNHRIEDALLKLDEGEVSEIVPILYGFQILKLVEHNPTYVRPLEEVRPMVLENLREQKRQQAEAELYREVLADPELKPHYETHFYRAGRADAPDEEMIFRIGEDLFTAADYRRIYRTTTDLVRMNLATPEGRKTYLEENAFRPHLFTYVMLESGLLDQPDYRLRFESAREQILAQAWLDQRYEEFLDERDLKEETVREYYEENLARFTEPAHYAVTELLVQIPVTGSMSRDERNARKERAREKAFELLKAVQNGASPAAARAELYPQDETIKVTDIPLQPLSDYRGMVQASLSNHEEIGLIEELVPLDDAFVVVVVTDYVTSEPKPLQEVRERIEEDLSMRDWAQRRQEIEEELLDGMNLQFRDGAISELVRQVNRLEESIEPTAVAGQT